MRRFWILGLMIFISFFASGKQYLIYSGDALLGTEKVTVSEDRIITDTSLDISGIKLSFTQALTFEDNKPTFYSANINKQVNVTGKLAAGSAVYTVANQSKNFFGQGLFPVENNTFYLWSYVFLNAPETLVVPSLLTSLRPAYSTWEIGPYGTRVRTVIINRLSLTGYFLDNDLIRLTIPLQNIDVIKSSWLEVFRDKTPERINSESVVLKRESDLLHGELNFPKNKSNFPVVLLLNGSGPQDRDNNAPPEMTNSLFKNLSNRLIESGIGTLRFDDRGMGKSTGSHMDQDLETLLEDAKEALLYLKKRPDVDQIGILGHSEGGLIALKLASEENFFACALLATPSIPLDRLMIEQLDKQRSLPEITSQQKKQLDDLLDLVILSINMAKQGDKMTPIGFSGKYLLDHISFNPIAYADKITCPVLILQGLQDFKVLPYHAESLHSAVQNSLAETVKYPFLNHYFTASPIGNPDFTIDAAFKTPKEVYDDITRFFASKINSTK